MTGSCPWRSSIPTSPMASSATSRCRSYITPSTGSTQSKTVTLFVPRQCSTESWGCWKCCVCGNICSCSLCCSETFQSLKCRFLFFIFFILKNNVGVWKGSIQTAVSFLLRLSALQWLKGNEMSHWGGRWGRSNSSRHCRDESPIMCTVYNKNCQSMESQTAGRKI